MTPARTSGKTGAYEIDRIYENVGRVRRSLGTSSLREYRNRVALIDKLHKTERYDILRAFKDKRLTIEQLIEADRGERLGATLVDLSLDMSLWDAIEATLPKLGKSARTRELYCDVFTKLQTTGADWLRDTARVADLATVPWAELREGWGTKASRWMHLRIALSSFLSTYLADKYHPFVRAFRRAFATEAVPRRYPSLTPAMFLDIVERTPAHAAVAYWALLITGMRVASEYLKCGRTHLVPAAHMIHVPGTKTEGSARPILVTPSLWPHIDAAIPSRLQYKWLRKYWCDACLAAGYATKVPHLRRPDPEHPGDYLTRYQGPTLHDLRHCHGQWAIDAGMPEVKVQASLRHDDPNQTREYTMRLATREVSTALADIITAAQAARKSA